MRAEGVKQQLRSQVCRGELLDRAVGRRVARLTWSLHETETSVRNWEEYLCLQVWSLPVYLFIFTKVLQDKFLKKINFYSSPKGDKRATEVENRSAGNVWYLTPLGGAVLQQVGWPHSNRDSPDSGVAAGLIGSFVSWLISFRKLDQNMTHFRRFRGLVCFAGV